MTVNCKIVSVLEYVAPVQRVKTVTLLDYKASHKRLLLLEVTFEDPNPDFPAEWS